MYDRLSGLILGYRVFVEGEPLYPGAAIQRFNHIQVCVRNPDCIKGYFRLREGPPTVSSSGSKKVSTYSAMNSLA